jgi:multiple sugar transport system ATP-binding protein
MASVTLRNVPIGTSAGEAGFNLEIKDREFVVLAGPAGCGNSTILRVIAGLTGVSQGEVLLGDRRINEIPPADRGVAFLSPDHALYPGMSVYENLALGLQRRKFAKPEIGKRIRAAAEILGLQDHLRRRPPDLSAEERQRVGLARAMVHQPKVFLFDEPFSVLPIEARMRGRAEIKKLHQRLPATMIYATHDPVEALAMGERTVMLDRGVVQQDDNAKAIYDRPANLFVARFSGSPPMNLVHGTLKEDRDSLLFSETGDGSIAVRVPASRFAGVEHLVGKPIVLGIRPEDIEITSGTERSPTSFKALVDRVEPRGSETDLYLQTGAHQLICRSRQWVDQGEGGHRFQFEIDLRKAHFFDPAAGRVNMSES